jgi:hypothetical protein
MGNVEEKASCDSPPLKGAEDEIKETELREARGGGVGRDGKQRG